MTSTRNPMPSAIVEKAASILQIRLSETLALTALLKHAHWNISGPNFIATHEMLDRLKDEFDDHSDTLAERLKALGEFADGDVRTTASVNAIPDYPSKPATGPKHLEAVADAFAALSGRIRSDIKALEEVGDAISVDVLTEIGRASEKAL